MEIKLNFKSKIITFHLLHFSIPVFSLLLSKKKKHFLQNFTLHEIRIEKIIISSKKLPQND